PQVAGDRGSASNVHFVLPCSRVARGWPHPPVTSHLCSDGGLTAMPPSVVPAHRDHSGWSYVVALRWPSAGLASAAPVLFTREAETEQRPPSPGRHEGPCRRHEDHRRDVYVDLHSQRLPGVRIPHPDRIVVAAADHYGSVVQLPDRHRSDPVGVART